MIIQYLSANGVRGEEFVQANQPPATAILETAPAEAVEELVHPAHAAEYSRRSEATVAQFAPQAAWLPQIRRIWSTFSWFSRCAARYSRMLFSS